MTTTIVIQSIPPATVVRDQVTTVATVPGPVQHVSTPQVTVVQPINHPTVVAVNDATRQAIVAGQTGLQGPAGPSGAVNETRVAAETLGGHRIVRSTGAGTAGYASSADTTHGDDTIGMTLGAAVAGDPVNVQRAGAITHAGWAWIPGAPVFLGLLGQPTQAAPDAGVIQVIGHAESATTLFLALSPPVYF